MLFSFCKYVSDERKVLSSYLAKRGPEFVHGRNILELGSGTGLVGLVAAKLQLQKTTPARATTPTVWITDQACVRAWRTSTHLTNDDRIYTQIQSASRNHAQKREIQRSGLGRRCD